MAWVNIIDLFYPVGTIYEAYDNVNSPAALFGGSWTELTTTSPYRWRRTA